MQQVDVGNVATAVEHEFVAVDDSSLPDHEHVHARDGLLALNADDVGVEITRGNGVLAISEEVDGVDARLDATWRPL